MGDKFRYPLVLLKDTILKGIVVVILLKEMYHCIVAIGEIYLEICLSLSFCPNIQTYLQLNIVFCAVSEVTVSIRAPLTSTGPYKGTTLSDRAHAHGVRRANIGG